MPSPPAPAKTETTDTGSAFSYLESSSLGQSVMPDGGTGALEAFTGPVYSLVAALLEQDMARGPRDKRGHRFLELFYLSNGRSFQVGGAIFCSNSGVSPECPFTGVGAAVMSALTCVAAGSQGRF